MAASDHARLTERKIKPDGSVQEFGLELLGQTSEVAVGRYRVAQPATFAAHFPFTVPPNSISDGYFWVRRPYSVYRFRGAGGNVLGHRVDAVSDVVLEPGCVSYRDLALDWWVLPNGSVIEEDLDEFEGLLGSGLFSLEDAKKAEEARRAVVGEWTKVAAELARLEGKWAPQG